jgi:hypothetical protein
LREHPGQYLLVQVDGEVSPLTGQPATSWSTAMFAPAEQPADAEVPAPPACAAAGAEPPLQPTATVLMMATASAMTTTFRYIAIRIAARTTGHNDEEGRWDGSDWVPYEDPGP